MTKSDFILGGVAAQGAVLITNPIDVVKTRMQLQGELARQGTYAKPYKNMFHAMKQVIRKEGFLALGKGLVPGLYFQFFLNATRLGIYSNALEHGLLHDDKGNVSFVRGMLCGGLGGAIGTFISSPFNMLKTQLQSRSHKGIAVGYQHKHSTMIGAMKHIYETNGFLGFWRGALSSVNRIILASSFTFGAFPKTKNILKENGWVTHPMKLSIAAGVTAGTVLALTYAPFDILATRLYNQPADEHGRGLMYKNNMDCLFKIVRTEGWLGLYKGFWSIYFRNAPHSTLIFVFFDKLRDLRDRHVYNRVYP